MEAGYSHPGPMRETEGSSLRQKTEETVDIGPRRQRGQERREWNRNLRREETLGLAPERLHLSQKQGLRVRAERERQWAGVIGSKGPGQI